MSDTANTTGPEVFEDELPAHIAESMKDPAYRAAHLATHGDDCEHCAADVPPSEPAQVDLLSVLDRAVERAGGSYRNPLSLARAQNTPPDALGATLTADQGSRVSVDGPEVLSEAERALVAGLRDAYAETSAVQRLCDLVGALAVELDLARESEARSIRFAQNHSDARIVALAERDAALAERDRARDHAALLEADGARLRERVAALAERWSSATYGDQFPTFEGGWDSAVEDFTADLRALLAEGGEG